MDVVFKRNREIQQLLRFRGNGKIKVIEGLRQVGKSFLLKELFYKTLLDLGVKNEEIALLDFLEKDDEIREEAELKAKVRSLAALNPISYLFMDEIQLVKGFGTALKTLHLQNPDIDIYVTGSNSKTLSKDIQREIGVEDSCEVIVRPLTFEEACEDYPSFRFSDYFSYGGLPKVVRADGVSGKNNAFETLYRETYEKDILDRTTDLKNIGENEKKKILQRVFDTITTGLSLKTIAKQINADNKSQNKNSSAVHADIDTYFKRLVDSFLFEGMDEDASDAHESGKNHIENRGKCYCEDPGLLRYASRAKDLDSAVFENIVFMNLFSKGYRPVSLKFDYVDLASKAECKNRGVDFYFEKNGENYLVQAVLVLLDGENYQREVGNLRHCQRTGKRLVVYFYDRTSSHPDAEGVEFLQVEDFLKNI